MLETLNFRVSNGYNDAKQAYTSMKKAVNESIMTESGSRMGVNELSNRIVSYLYDNHPEISYLGDAKVQGSRDIFMRFEIPAGGVDKGILVDELKDKFGEDRIGTAHGQSEYAPELKRFYIVAKANQKSSGPSGSASAPAVKQDELPLGENDETEKSTVNERMGIGSELKSLGHMFSGREAAANKRSDNAIIGRVKGAGSFLKNIGTGVKNAAKGMKYGLGNLKSSVMSGKSKYQGHGFKDIGTGLKQGYSNAKKSYSRKVSGATEKDTPINNILTLLKEMQENSGLLADEFKTLGEWQKKYASSSKDKVTIPVNALIGEFPNLQKVVSDMLSRAETASKQSSSANESVDTGSIEEKDDKELLSYVENFLGTVTVGELKRDAGKRAEFLIDIERLRTTIMDELRTSEEADRAVIMLMTARDAIEKFTKEADNESVNETGNGDIYDAVAKSCRISREDAEREVESAAEHIAEDWRDHEKVDMYQECLYLGLDADWAEQLAEIASTIKLEPNSQDVLDDAVSKIKQDIGSDHVWFATDSDNQYIECGLYKAENETELLQKLEASAKKFGYVLRPSTEDKGHYILMTEENWKIWDSLMADEKKENEKKAAEAERLDKERAASRANWEGWD